MALTCRQYSSVGDSSGVDVNTGDSGGGSPDVMKDNKSKKPNHKSFINRLKNFFGFDFQNEASSTRSLVPQSQSHNLDPLASSPTTPGPVTPGSMTLGPSTPDLATPGPVTPGSMTLSPLTPAPVTPGPVTPGPGSPETNPTPEGVTGATGSLVSHFDENKVWPPPPEKWPIEWLLVCGFWIVYLFYTNWAARERTLETLADEIRWGGELDQLHAFSKLNTYLHMEALGVKISYKFAQMGLVEEILCAFTTPRSKEIKDNAAKLLSKLTAKNREIRLMLLHDGVLATLRNHVDVHNIHVLYTIANLSEEVSGSKKILTDTNLMNDLLYTMAYTFKSQRSVEERYVQRALLRTFSNLLSHPDAGVLIAPFASQLDNLLTNKNNNLMLDDFSWIYYIKILKKINQNSDSEKQVIFPILGQISGLQGIDLANTADQNEELVSLGIGTSIVGMVSLAWAYFYQRFYYLRRYYPLTLYQKKWSRKQILRTPLLSMVFFILHQSLVKLDERASDYLAYHPDDGRDPEKDFLGHFAWEKHKSSAQSFLMALHLMRLPVYYMGLRFSHYSLIPGLMPWKVHCNTAPEWLLTLLPWYHYWNYFLFHPPSIEEPNPSDLYRILDGTDKQEMDKMQEMFQQFSKMER